MIAFISKERFFAAAAATGDSYWRKSAVGRWRYMDRVIRMLRKHRPHSMLELGAKGIPLSPVSDTMDIEDCPGLTYLHDADKFPWPVKDRQYEGFMALQVLEHLRDKESAMRESFRVSGTVVWSVPYMWPKHRGDHAGIGIPQMVAWAGGLQPAETKIVGLRNRRLICVWRTMP